jgi:hypothetical protein
MYNLYISVNGDNMDNINKPGIHRIHEKFFEGVRSE